MSPRCALAVLLLLCISASSSAVDLSDLLDLTHPFNNKSLCFPTLMAKGARFRSFPFDQGQLPSPKGPIFFDSRRFEDMEHCGTHVDAPSHFQLVPDSDAPTIDRVPLEALVGRAVVVDISRQAARTVNYQMRVDDIRRHEARHGRIPDRSIVLVFADWSKRYPNAERYFGTADGNDIESFAWPSLTDDAARFLVHQRRIMAIALDFPSVDQPRLGPPTTHIVLLGAGVPIVENACCFERIRARRPFFLAMPTKLEGGSGGPIRVAVADWRAEREPWTGYDY